MFLTAVAAAMLMISGPSEAKMFGRSGSSTESSQSGYDMTGKLELVTMSLLQLQVVHIHHKSCWRLVPPRHQAPWSEARTAQRTNGCC